MLITYHKEISPKGNEIRFPFDGFDEEIRSYLCKKLYLQEEYFISYNGYFLFIYLINGDRIDINLKG